ncbi:MAG: TRAP transporter TatT component family protein [Thermoanaerobaculia bacterium]|nr:TRAP transporter TatT component family protein [Thermoanaerobaculia bacterium]
MTRTTALARLALPLAALLAGPALRAGEESAAALARGDAAWAGRAAGHRGGRAAPEPIAAAVAACEEALRHDPQSLEAHWKLMRALWFQGDYATADAAARRDLFARGRELGERAKQLLAARAGAGKELAKLPPAERARRLAAEPDAAPVHFWAAVHWGLWGRRSASWRRRGRGWRGGSATTPRPSWPSTSGSSTPEGCGCSAASTTRRRGCRW